MPRAKFRCARCKRNFKMAAHLGRHMSTIHGSTASRRSKTAANKKSGRRPGRPVGRPAGRSPSFQTGGDGVARLLSDMHLYHSNLTNQRSSLDMEIDAVASAMKVLGSGASTGGTRQAPGKTKRKVGRPKGSRRAATATAGPRSGPRRGSLKDFIVRVLGQNSKPLSPQDIGARVVKAGFKTKAKDLTKAVSNVLPSIKKVKRVGFGQYQLPH